MHGCVCVLSGTSAIVWNLILLFACISLMCNKVNVCIKQIHEIGASMRCSSWFLHPRQPSLKSNNSRKKGDHTSERRKKTFESMAKITNNMMALSFQLTKAPFEKLMEGKYTVYQTHMHITNLTRYPYVLCWVSKRYLVNLQGFSCYIEPYTLPSLAIDASDVATLLMLRLLPAWSATVTAYSVWKFYQTYSQSERGWESARASGNKQCLPFRFSNLYIYGYTLKCK